mmetsp:Transcript_6175/g.8693  ORF Transcript_6175/g.8693 Transcript_6175/m.8693 type:complete len:589 (-) Transcript_6175:260-2026(-)|eukprot:CAMPEP_0197300816 /NCGR_PEP_ID=MMETSP0890-20130614/49274_1 /TAXON_ID=44058 ORGANISM="Aureoumbra lagunensis, Strain CCMP1510" /NCGR_SAMPLE_ID=MMETSP0890 /ASSEMBLY_ACC=CAM_ASM_000533 /LENGTH=588 /DNA_ID=CAMNT_0042779867 /DNA_START=60 /DNA_END=1826 /DNA_ORIENTATION=-
MALLVRREIDSSVDYGHPHLYVKSSSGTILQDLTMSTMSGTLGQLGLLSHYATEMFQDLFKLTEDVYRRVETIQSRTDKIISQYEAIEAKTVGGDGNANGIGDQRSGMGSSGGVRRINNDEPNRVTFDMSSMPRSLKERYESEEVQKTPDMSKVDVLVPAYVEKNGPCLRKYTYPGLFLDQWAAEEMERIAILKRKKAERKADRKERKRLALKEGEEVDEASSKTPGKKVVKTGLNWKARYLGNDVTDSPRGIPKAVAPPDAANQSTSTITTDVGGPSSPAARSSGSSIRPPSLRSDKNKIGSPGAGMHEDDVAQAGRTETIGKKTPPPPPMPRIDSNKLKPPPPPPPKLFSEQDQDDEDGGVDESALHLPSSSPQLDVVVSQNDEDEDDERFEAPKTAKESQEYAKFFTMLRMGIPKAAVQLKMTAEGLDPSILDEDSEDEEDENVDGIGSAVADDIQSIARDSEVSHSPALLSKKSGVEDMSIEEAPPSMPRPNALLGAIQQGATLKKVEVRPVSSSAAAPKNDLLAAIRGGGANLRKREEEPAKPAATKHNTGLFAVDKILSLRSKVAADDSDSDDDDEWDSDDD